MTPYFLLFQCLFISGIYAVKFATSKADEQEVPTDLIAVSKFIKEFHKKLEDDSYPSIKSDMNDRELPALIENISFYTMKTELPDKNVSSLVKCTSKPIGTLTVELVNTTRLSSLLTADPNVTSRLMEGSCLALFFFSPSCPFSCLAAPHFNALPRAFPNIKMAAINAIQHQTFNTQFGIAGVPTLMLFHNGKAAAKFNDSDYTLEMFAKFITRVTGMKAEQKMFASSSDFGGPVPTVLVRETDYVLGLAWAVIILAVAYRVTRLERWHAFVESVAAVWRESNHEHTD
uniref:Thioredoxin domain-containing protein n=1 Tax=Riptortus pedestris TaxID=329032 RepID=R4WR93_RIPPE|nr:conserved hypothetical protein [Riptortus pedestris]